MMNYSQVEKFGASPQEISEPWRYESFTILACSLFCLLWCYIAKGIIQTSSKFSLLPPGPPAFPVVGSLFSLSQDLRRSFGDLARKYGPVCGLWLGPHYTVLINDAEVLREAFVKRGDVFSARKNLFVMHAVTDGLGIIDNVNPVLWKKQRKFAVTCLRKMTKEHLHDVTEREFQLLLGDLATMGPGGNLAEIFGISFSSVVVKLMLGEKCFQRGGSAHRKLLHLMMDNIRLLNITAPVNTFTWMYYIPSFKRAYKQLMQNRNEIRKIIREIVAEHSKHHNPDNLQDFADWYIKQIKVEDSNGNTDFNVEELVRVCADIVIAGTESTTKTLLWALVLLGSHTDVACKLQSEIDQVTCSEKNQRVTPVEMPYASAILKEVLRFSSVASIGMPHATSRDTYLRGHFIPRDSIVIANLWYIHHDQKTWGDPSAFRPERFLEKSQTQTNNLVDLFMPFGIGRRMCLGRHIAQTELLVFLVGLMRRFDVSFAGNLKNLRGNFDGLMNNPPDADVQLLPRSGGLVRNRSGVVSNG